jgi:hypothetical protein
MAKYVPEDIVYPYRRPTSWAKMALKCPKVAQPDPASRATAHPRNAAVMVHLRLATIRGPTVHDGQYILLPLVSQPEKHEVTSCSGHRCRIIETKGESYRLQDAKARTNRNAKSVTQTVDATPTSN